MVGGAGVGGIRVRFSFTVMFCPGKGEGHMGSSSETCNHPGATCDPMDFHVLIFVHVLFAFSCFSFFVCCFVFLEF